MKTHRAIFGALLAVVMITVSSCHKRDASGPASGAQPTSASSAPQPGDVMTNGIGMKLIWISAGEFMMGSPSDEAGRLSDESPQRKVTIRTGFWLGQTEVTQGQYRAVMETNPSRSKGDLNLPVETVSWKDAMMFCKKLGQKEGKTYTLPTEAQWEYACRAGTMTAYCYGNSASPLDGYAVYGRTIGWERSYIFTRPVETRRPNAWGLYDMHGNVWEWCLDWYQADYEGLGTMDPQGPATGTHRVLRGGGWDSTSAYCRSAVRNADGKPDTRISVIGFRVVLN